MLKELPLVLLAAILLSACDSLEIVDSYYPDYGHLKNSNEPGNWVPAFIPRSAVEIRERHKIDTAAELLTFTFGGYKEMSLDGHCKNVPANDVVLPASGFLRVTWWPKPLFGGHASKSERDQYEFYRCERQAFLALKKVGDRHQAFYWRISLT